jgi:hypothetical protein
LGVVFFSRVLVVVVVESNVPTRDADESVVLETDTSSGYDGELCASLNGLNTFLCTCLNFWRTVNPRDNDACRETVPFIFEEDVVAAAESVENGQTNIDEVGISGSSRSPETHILANASNLPQNLSNTNDNNGSMDIRKKYKKHKKRIILPGVKISSRRHWGRRVGVAG